MITPEVFYYTKAGALCNLSDSMHDSGVESPASLSLYEIRLTEVYHELHRFPEYCDHYFRTLEFLMRGDGPLCFEYRHIIAIMAAARHQCSYLVTTESAEFLEQGGNELWLKGLQHLPRKLRDFAEMSKLLAHRPWMFDSSHVEKLAKQSSWSLGELMHAIVISAHFNCLASFVAGCRLDPESEKQDAATFVPVVLPADSDDSNSSDDLASPVPCAITQTSHHQVPGIPCTIASPTDMKAARRLSYTNTDVSGPAPIPVDMQCRVVNNNAYEKIEQQNMQLKMNRHCVRKPDLLRFVEDTEFAYKDFARRNHPNEHPTLKAQDYTWEDQGYSLVNLLYNEIASTLLDAKFRLVCNLNPNRLSSSPHVDTATFWRAAWYYIHSLYGVRHDDYDYAEINRVIHIRQHKAYMKMASCFPDRIDKNDYDQFIKDLTHSESVQILMVLMEGRLQAELIYALRAVSGFMTR